MILKICCALPSLRQMFIVLYAYDFHFTWLRTTHATLNPTENKKQK